MGLASDQSGPTAAGTGDPPAHAEAAIRTDRRLSESQRRALLTVYRSYVGGAAMNRR